MDKNKVSLLSGVIFMFGCLLGAVLSFNNGYSKGFDDGSLAGARYANEEWTKELKRIK